LIANFILELVLLLDSFVLELFSTFLRKKKMFGSKGPNFKFFFQSSMSFLEPDEVSPHSFSFRWFFMFFIFSCIHHLFNFDMVFLNVGSDKVHCWLNVHFNHNLLQLSFCIYTFFYMFIYLYIDLFSPMIILLVVYFLLFNFFRNFYIFRRILLGIG